jgi:hypothetical protein
VAEVRPTTHELFSSVRTSAMHLELRDVYTPADPDWNEWHSGSRFNPAERWSDWYNLMRETTGRGVEVRRARIVSEPVTDYIRFEYDVTSAHNIAAGELVRWLPRHRTSGLVVPPTDFWVLDGEVVVWNHFAGDGAWVGKEYSEDPDVAKVCSTSFEAVWERAVPHEEYQPT